MRARCRHALFALVHTLSGEAFSLVRGFLLGRGYIHVWIWDLVHSSLHGSFEHFQRARGRVGLWAKTALSRKRTLYALPSGVSASVFCTRIRTVGVLYPSPWRLQALLSTFPVAWDLFLPAGLRAGVHFILFLYATSPVAQRPRAAAVACMPTRAFLASVCAFAGSPTGMRFICCAVAHRSPCVSPLAVSFAVFAIGFVLGDILS
jgi:hypothetical protein